MKTYQISKDIHAPVERVWRVLIEDLAKDPKPFGILRFEGTLALGCRVKLWSEIDPKRAFALTVAKFDAPTKMVWKGGMPLGLFVGTRTFRLRAQGGRTIFEMQEVFSGPLSGLITKSIPDLNPSFQKFAATVKERAENQ